MWGGEYEASFHSGSDRRLLVGGESTRLGGVNEITAGKASLSWRGGSKLCQKLFTFVSWTGLTVSGGRRSVCPPPPSFLWGVCMMLGYALENMRLIPDCGCACARFNIHSPPHGREIWMSDASSTLFPITRWTLTFKYKTLVSRGNRQQSPSHLKELITVVAEAHTWITTTRPVSSHLQVSIEHTLSK